MRGKTKIFITGEKKVYDSIDWLAACAWQRGSSHGRSWGAAQSECTNYIVRRSATLADPGELGYILYEFGGGSGPRTGGKICSCHDNF